MEKIYHRRLYLVRHAEAIKNIQKMHGSGVQRLTFMGEKQAELLQNKISQVDSIWCQKEMRTQYTAHVLSDTTGVNVEISDEISGVGLGVIKDLNEEQLERLYPEVFDALTRWKAGNGNLDSYPNVPGREHMEHFFKRIKCGMEEIISKEGTVVFIGTTSTLNMMIHLLEHSGAFVRKDYLYTAMELGSIRMWQNETNSLWDGWYEIH